MLEGFVSSPKTKGMVCCPSILCVVLFIASIKNECFLFHVDRKVICCQLKGAAIQDGSLIKREGKASSR
jgi:hypothetical protein